MGRYSKSDVECILSAYRALFPEPSLALEAYWDLGRHLPWSVLTTDFWAVDSDKLEEFHQGYASAIDESQPHSFVGKALANYAKSQGVGYAIGVSPWTDDLLLETYRPGSSEVVIVLGHDWYPIACDSYRALPPLTRMSARDEYGFAFGDVPSGVGVVFVNLYPHFRAPGADCIGRIPGADYKACVRGFLAMCKAIAASGHVIRGIISWGLPVWEELGWGAEKRWRLGINAAWRQVESEGPVLLPIGEQAVPYYPFLHPSALHPRFQSPEHFAAYHRTWKALMTAAPISAR